MSEDVMARLRLRAQKNHTTVEGFVKYLLERDSERITVEEAIERSRKNSRGSGVTADETISGLD